jgi:hypothetical protein
MAVPSSHGADRARKRYRLVTPAGVIEIWVMRAYPDGTVDVLCTCCGARWEQRHVLLADGPMMTPVA